MTTLRMTHKAIIMVFHVIRLGFIETINNSDIYILELDEHMYEFKREDKYVKTRLSMVSPEDVMKLEKLNHFVVTVV
tara:strand:- start:805 stop:1035 length:231 start_codon:yes stop_codon:yes gene_type:complete